MKKTLFFLTLVLFAQDKKLTPEDREPVHLAYEQLIVVEARIMQLQQQHEEMNKKYQSLLEGLKKKCGGDILQDKNDLFQCKEDAHSK